MERRRRSMLTTVPRIHHSVNNCRPSRKGTSSRNFTITRNDDVRFESHRSMPFTLKQACLHEIEITDFRRHRRRCRHHRRHYHYHIIIVVVIVRIERGKEDGPCRRESARPPRFSFGSEIIVLVGRAFDALAKLIRPPRHLSSVTLDREASANITMLIFHLYVFTT